jgi:short-subunit dehydrogenase
MGGKLVFPGGGLYHGTKFAVEAVSDALRFEVKGYGVDVIIIEPGLIVTNFGDAAAGSVDEEVQGTDYDDFNTAVAKETAGVYEGPMKRLGGGPEVVGAAIEKAITKKRPRTRYPVTPSARLALGQRKLMTDKMWDRVMRSQFPSPGAGG